MQFPPKLGIDPVSLALADGFFTAKPPGKPLNVFSNIMPLVFKFKDYFAGTYIYKMS